MNEIIVPIDITQEEKSILAIFSMRQFFLVVPTIVISLIFLFWGSLPFIGGFVDFIIRFVIFALGNASAVALAFFKIEKYELFLSEYLWTLLMYRKSQKVYMS